MGTSRIDIKDLKEVLELQIQELIKRGLLPALDVKEFAAQVAKELLENNLLPEDLSSDNLFQEKTQKALGLACLAIHMQDVFTELKLTHPNLKLQFKFDLRLLFTNELDLENDPEKIDQMALRNQLKALFLMTAKMHPQLSLLPEAHLDALANAFANKVMFRMFFDARRENTMVGENPTLLGMLEGMLKLAIDLMGLVDVRPDGTVLPTKTTAGTADPTGLKTINLFKNLGKFSIDSNLEQKLEAELYDTGLLPKTAPTLTPPLG